MHRLTARTLAPTLAPTGWIFALALPLAILLGCGAPQQQGGTEPAESAVEHEMGAEFQSASLEEFAPIPDHWTAEGEVGRGAGPVTQAMLNDPFASLDRWLHYYGNYAGHRHSPLTTLNPDTVGGLEVAWTLATGTTGQFEVSPG